jgi:type IV pilus assembly protein PilY1
MSYLTAVYYQTGTSWHEAVFHDGTTQTDPAEVISRLDLGHGLAVTPNLHVGREDGAKAFVQTSTGAIVEIEQPNLPLTNVKSGRINWRSD